VATRDQLEKLAILLDEDPQAVDDEDVQKRLREKLPKYLSQIQRVTAEQRENVQSLADILGIPVPPYHSPRSRSAY
jgi:hypothetical protein